VACTPAGTTGVPAGTPGATPGAAAASAGGGVVRGSPVVTIVTGFSYS
jgi:hypothetical protein